jgi:hypothetical protein
MSEGEMMATQEKDAESPAPKASELTSKVLDFLSTANNETLGACVVGLGVVTYFVLGRVGLVLIGAVGGVVLHATWEGEQGKESHDSVVEAKRRKEVGIDIVKRLLDASGKSVSGKNENDENIQDQVDVLVSSHKELNFDDFEPATSAALDSLVDAVIGDYVKYAKNIACNYNYDADMLQVLVLASVAKGNLLSICMPSDTHQLYTRLLDASVAKETSRCLSELSYKFYLYFHSLLDRTFSCLDGTWHVRSGCLGSNKHLSRRQAR